MASFDKKMGADIDVLKRQLSQTENPQLKRSLEQKIKCLEQNKEVLK